MHTIRQTKFPGKEARSLSFNLTESSRNKLKELSSELHISQGDVIEFLIREQVGSGIYPKLNTILEKKTGPKGGAKSYFFGKNRGITTAVCVTSNARKWVDEQSKDNSMSRGDYLETLIRLKHYDHKLNNLTEVYQ